MDSKYVLLALVMACSHDFAYAHILPSRQMDYPMTECVKSLTRHMLNLCSSYGNYQSELFLDNGMPLIPREVTNRSWELRERIIQSCCSRPCSASELLAIC